MKIIKTFQHFNDTIINEFLKQTKGKIVNFNPLVIEYDDKINFIDPYEGYKALACDVSIMHSKISNIDTNGVYDFKNKSEAYNSKVDVILFPIKGKIDNLRFMLNGKVVFDATENDYFNIDLRKYENFPTEKFQLAGAGYYHDVQYNFDYIRDHGMGQYFMLDAFLESCGCKQLNYI